MYGATPQAQDMYSRYMVDRFNEKDLISVPTGFQAFFGVPSTGAKTVFSENSAVIDIDIIRGNERIAALIPRGGISRTVGDTQKNTEKERYSTFSRLYPLVEEEGDLNANQILTRTAGENPYDMRTRLDRLRTLANDQHKEQIRRSVRLFEVLAASSILTGTMPAILGTTNAAMIYDFLRKSTHTFAAPAKWDTASPDIMNDFDTAWELGRQDAYLSYDMALVGTGAIDALAKDSTMQSLADNRRYELVLVNPNMPVPEKFARFVNAGMTAYGRLRTTKGREIWLFTYNDGYTSAGGTFTPYMPVDQVLITSSNVRCDRYFGPPERLPVTSGEIQWYKDLFGMNMNTPMLPPNVKGAGSIVTPSMFYCDAYPTNNRKNVSCRTQSAPIFATTQTDGFVTITGVV